MEKSFITATIVVFMVAAYNTYLVVKTVKRTNKGSK